MIRAIAAISQASKRLRFKSSGNYSCNTFHGATDQSVCTQSP
jgi:hypothetical protein